MSTNIDPRRSVAAWLEAEAPDRAPARLIDASRERIRTTRQRPAWWPARRTTDMNSFAKLAMAAAAVVVVALVGYNLLPTRGGVGVTPATPSPSISPSPADTSPRPLQSGAIEPGTYTLALAGVGATTHLTVPAGWVYDGGFILQKGGVSADPPAGHAIAFWTGDIQVYADPCQWEGTEPDPPTGLTARDVVDALAAQPQRGEAPATERRAAGPDRPDQWDGWSIDLTVPTDADLVGGPCDQGQFRSWGPERNARYHQGAGQRDLIWAVDVDGTRIVVVVASFPGTPPETMTEIDAILDSMVFVPNAGSG
jgi:hypothetical protein